MESKMYETNINEENSNQKPLSKVQRGTATFITLLTFGVISAVFLGKAIDLPLQLMTYSILSIIGLILFVGGAFWLFDTLNYMRKQL